MSGRHPPDISRMVSLKVDNLSYRTTEVDLRPVFEKYGDIGDIYIPRDRYSFQSRGFAFVRYYEKRDAEKALDRLDGYTLDGREVRVQYARFDRPDNARARYLPGGSRYRSSYGRSPSPRDRRHRRDSRRSRSRDRGRYRRRSRSYSRSRSRSQSQSRSRSRSRSRRRDYKSTRDESKDRGSRRDSRDDSKSPRKRDKSQSPASSRSRSRSARSNSKSSKSPSSDKD